MQKEIISPFILETGLNESTAQRIFAKFFDSLPQDLDQLTAAVDAQDWAKASLLAHTLKGSSSNLRLKDLAMKASILDLDCRSQLAGETKTSETRTHLKDLRLEAAKIQASYIEI